MRILLITLLLSSISWLSFAQTQLGTQAVDAYFESAINVNPFAEFHITRESLLLSDVQQLTQWQTHTEFTSIPELSVLWVRFNINNNSTTNRMLTLIAGSVFVDRVDVFLLDEQGRIVQSARSQDEQANDANLSRKSFKMNMVSRGESTFTVYIRI